MLPIKNEKLKARLAQGKDCLKDGKHKLFTLN